MDSNKKQKAINTHLWLPVALFVIFVTIGIVCIIEKEVWLSVGFFVAALLPLFVFLVSPLYYVFSKESVEIIYLWGQKEEIQWDEIRSITRFGGWFSLGGGTSRYNIAYPTDKKRAFFINGDVYKTRKTKELIQKYYKRNIV